MGMLETILGGIFVLLVIGGAIAGAMLHWINKWKSIESINQGLGISRETVYDDKNGYLRWKDTSNLCHRDIAYKNYIGNKNFNKMQVHHIDENKHNNQPWNLRVVEPKEHMEMHGLIRDFDGKTYRKLCHVSKIYRETSKAYLIAHVWVPKSLCVEEDRFIYVQLWFYSKNFD